MGLGGQDVEGAGMVPSCEELTSSGETSSQGRRVLAQIRSMEPARKASTPRREILARETQTKMKSFFPSNKKVQAISDHSKVDRSQNTWEL